MAIENIDSSVIAALQKIFEGGHAWQKPEYPLVEAIRPPIIGILPSNKKCAGCKCSLQLKTQVVLIPAFYQNSSRHTVAAVFCTVPCMESFVRGKNVEIGEDESNLVKPVPLRDRSRFFCCACGSRVAYDPKRHEWGNFPRKKLCDVCAAKKKAVLLTNRFCRDCGSPFSVENPLAQRYTKCEECRSK